ncbi:MAG: serine/threonine protein kinase [Deltaproteobacteria bacterium]|nr:serine/threonine protein kinase [Deltaproteobacteria bacterium]
MHPGEVIAGKYRIQSILGRGRGLLVEARHTQIDQRVVLRILPASHCSAKMRKRFRREAQTLSRLQSEHAAHVIDVGTLSDGSLYLAREHLEGVDLDEHIRQRGALGLEEAALLLLHAMDAVAECHSRQIVLREIKPSDLFLTTRRGGSPLLKVVDFGTAKIMREATSADGTGSTVLSIHPYCAPEIIRGGMSLDERTDIWALGAIFYTMLAACPPFPGEGSRLLLAITGEDPIPLSRLRPDLRPDIDQVVAWALAKSPAARFSSVYGFAHALRPYAPAEGQVLVDRIGQTSQAPPDLPPPGPLPRHVPRARGLPAPTPPPRKRGPMRSDLDRTEHLEELEQAAAALAAGRAEGRRAAVSPRELLPSRPGAGEAGSAHTPPPSLRSVLLSEQRRVAVWALGVALVVLPVLVVIYVVAARKEPGELAALVDGGAVPDHAPAAPPPGVRPGAAPRPAPHAARPAGRPGAPDRERGNTEPPREPPPAEPPEAEPPAPDESGGVGTLAAVVTGGKCTFSVDGAGRGSGAQLRVKLPAGAHRVSCKPDDGGPTMTREVTVRDGGTAFVAFSIQ